MTKSFVISLYLLDNKFNNSLSPDPSNCPCSKSLVLKITDLGQTRHWPKDRTKKVDAWGGHRIGSRCSAVALLTGFGGQRAQRKKMQPCISFRVGCRIWILDTTNRDSGTDIRTDAGTNAETRPSILWDFVLFWSNERIVAFTNCHSAKTENWKTCATLSKRRKMENDIRSRIALLFALDFFFRLPPFLPSCPSPLIRFLVP